MKVGSFFCFSYASSCSTDLGDFTQEGDDKKKEREALERLVIVLGSHKDYLGYAVARNYANGLWTGRNNFLTAL